MIEVASVRRLGAHDRLEYWNDLIGATYPGMSVDNQAELFDAKLSVWHLSDLRMVKPFSTPAIVTRQPRSQAVYSEPKFVAHTLVRGKVSLDQRGRRATLNEGDMVICASDEYYRFETHTTHEMMVVEVARLAEAQGARVVHIEAEGMIHGFVNMRGALPSANADVEHALAAGLDLIRP